MAAIMKSKTLIKKLAKNGYRNTGEIPPGDYVEILKCIIDENIHKYYPIAAEAKIILGFFEPNIEYLQKISPRETNRINRYLRFVGRLQPERNDD